MLNPTGSIKIRIARYKPCYHADSCRKKYKNVDDMCCGMRCYMIYSGDKFDECPCIVIKDFVSETQLGELSTSFRSP